MNSDWRPVPDATETLADGRRREWACRDISAPAPVPVAAPIAQPQAADVELDSDPPSRPGHGFRRRQAQPRFADRVDDRVELDAVAQLRIDNARAGRDFERNTITTAKRLGIWQWVVLVFGLGSIGWGVWVSIRGGGEYPQTQPSAPNVRSRSDRSDRADRSGGSGGGSGVNHSRDLLIEWERSATWKRLRESEQEAARKAVEADR
jgi:hypothetical protein